MNPSDPLTSERILSAAGPEQPRDPDTEEDAAQGDEPTQRDAIPGAWLAVIAILALGALITGLGAVGLGPAAAPKAHAAEVATAPAALPADNADVVRNVDAVVTADLHGNTAGRVTACVRVTGNRVKITSFRVWDWSRHVYTRMGGGGRVIRDHYCATTGQWFRGRRSSVNASIVDQVNGAYGVVSVPVSG